MTTLNSIDLKESNLNNNDDSESIASDESEEIIEVDEDEYDRRKALCLADMKELETQFLKLKEELLNEKQNLIDQKLKEIEEEKADEYVIPVQNLKANMEFKVKLAQLMKEYRTNNVEHIYECEKMAIKQSLENDQMILLERQISKIQNEIRELEESRRQFLLDYNLDLLSQNEANLSSLLRPDASYIVYSLNDYDILEDLSIINMHNNLNI